jgi:hypothetical protein
MTVRVRSTPSPRPRGPLSAIRTLALLAGLAAVIASLLVVSPGATAAQAAACGGHRSVTVVVDFTHFRGKVKVACDRRFPSTGLAALTYAGFSYTFVPRQPGFICTIGREPRNCNGAPVSAYWSYWHAKPHGRWVYSSLGAASYHPKRGWVEGWAFGNGKPPRISPP